MDYKTEDRSLIRAYLLGELAGAEREVCEQRIMTDDEFYNQVLLAEDDLVEEYTLGRLTGKEKASFEAGFLSTPEGREQVSLINDLIRYASSRSAKRRERVSNRFQTGRWNWSFFNSYAGLLAAAVVILAVGLGIWRILHYESDVDKGAAALRTAYRDHRPVDARLTGFDYAPPLATRGGQENIDSVARDRAARILLDAVAERPGAASHHALGQFYLAERDFDKAIAQFEEALKIDPKNARAHADLGVSLLEKGKLERSRDESARSLEDFAKSLEHFNKALELDGDLLEALFNRALLYQEMMLPSQAEDDWRKYLERDSNSRWADEARHNLEQLEEQKRKKTQSKEQLFHDFLMAYQSRDDEGAWRAITRSRVRAGNFIVESLLDAYLEADSKGQNDEANSKLQMLSYAGELEARRVGDLYTSDLARFYKATTPRKRALLAQARALAKTGQAQISESDFEAASETYARAEKIFNNVGNQCESRFARYWLGICYFQQDDMRRSLATFQQLALSPENDNYKWLAVRSLNRLGDYYFTLNEYSKAIDYSSKSLKIAEQIQDSYGGLSTLSLLMEEYRYIGNYYQSLRYIQNVLALARISSLEPNQIWLHYDAIAWVFNSLGFHAAAIDYEQTALRQATEIKETSMTCVSYVRLGMMYANQQNYVEALRNAREAFEIARACSNKPVSQQMMAYSSLHIGSIHRQTGDNDKAIENFSRCIELYSEMESPTFLYQAHKGRLLSYIEAGDISLAKEELDATLKLYERYRSKIAEESNRNSFVDIEQDVFDVAIDFEYSLMNDPQRAFEYSEISRARSLLDARRNTALVADKEHGPELTFSSVTPPSSLKEIQEKLPEQAQILQYAALEDKLLIWVITKTGIEPVEENRSLGDLTDKIKAYLSLAAGPVRENEKELSRAAMDLYDILIKPAEPFLDPKKQLCIIPDKIINYLPFCALISPRSNKYLIEDYALEVSPSSSVFLDCSDAAQKKERAKSEMLLSVGNPSFDRGEFPALPDLPSAGREADEITAYYNSSRSFIAGRAREREVTTGMESSDVIHLALHSVVDEVSPMRSRLLLAKEPKVADKSQTIDGVLQAYEIYRMHLPRVRLVVLSACQTGVGRAYRGEGVVSIARPFIAVGVPLVVASYWPVDSNFTEEFMVSFHKYRKRENLSTVKALRQAQLEMLQSPQQRYHHPYYWAAFSVIGGYAGF